MHLSIGEMQQRDELIKGLNRVKNRSNMLNRLLNNENYNSREILGRVERDRATARTMIILLKITRTVLDLLCRLRPRRELVAEQDPRVREQEVAELEAGLVQLLWLP